METNKNIPTIDKLIEKVEIFNKEHPEYNYWVNIKLLEQVIDILNYSKWFSKFLILNKYNFEYENYYVIYWQVVHYIKYCYDNWNLEEIERILEFVDKKLQNKNEDINTLVQIWVLENLDIYSEILDNLVKIMPKYTKQIFLKYYSHYLK